MTIPKLFFATAAVFVLIGMGWGIEMSATGNHTLSPAHGHLNLIGFVLMSVIGTFYALSPDAASSRWARPHYVLHSLAVVTIVPGIVMALTGQGDTLAKIGSLLALASMLVFVIMILTHRLGQAPARG